MFISTYKAKIWRQNIKLIIGFNIFNDLWAYNFEVYLLLIQDICFYNSSNLT